MSVCQLDSMNIQENGIDIRIDIEQFCLRMCKAAKSYYDKINLEKDFSLYNTPVLDFIQVTQKKKADSIIALICGNENYAKGLKEALQFVSEHLVYILSNGNIKAKAYLDLQKRKDFGEKVDSSDIKKHKKDVLRIASELMLEKVEELPTAIDADIHSFIDLLEQEPFDQNSLKRYGLKNEDVVEVLKQVFGLKKRRM